MDLVDGRLGCGGAVKPDHTLSSFLEESSGRLELDDGARVAIIGGGPAGSFAAIFLLQLAERAGLGLDVDIYEPRSFDRGGPAGCNHCGGIVSESLVQMLAAEGINLPPTVVQRGIEEYRLHMDLGAVAIASPVDEQRIAAVYRGNGPRNGEDMPWDSFDGHLQMLAADRGAKIEHSLVLGIDRNAERPRLRLVDRHTEPYDLVIVAAGINTNLLGEAGWGGEEGPQTARTYISEFRSDAATIRERLGNAMHVFMIDVPGVEFAAVIPKGEYFTLAMLGHDIDVEVVEHFLGTEAVRRALPFDWVPCVCSCAPRINVRGPKRPYADRIVMIGDSGVTRLYKDGIGAAYRTAKAAATAAVLYGVSADDFEEHYRPVCRQITRDNRYGQILFAFTWLFRKLPFLRRAVLRMTRAEQESEARTGPMSQVLWNLFTGSAPYREVFWTTAKPWFLIRLVGHTLMSLIPSRDERKRRADA
jgi:flavin-dependent dehydrogenase